MKQGKHVKAKAAPRGYAKLSSGSAVHAKTGSEGAAGTWRLGLVKAVGYPAAFAALCGLAFGPGYAMATEAASEGAAQASGAAQVSTQTSNAVPAKVKDETVYAYANPDGEVRNAEVSVKLSNADGAVELADSSNLADIENTEGDETYRGSGRDIVWDADGNDIYYTGTTNAELPVSCKVTYRLDGRMMNAADMAGKSGRATVRYEFQNHAQAEADGVEVYTPFTCVTAMMLDNEVFSNIEAENAKVIDDADRSIVAGYALPGLKESLGQLGEDIDDMGYFEISADVDSFELGATLTMVSAGLMDDVDAGKLDEYDMTASADSMASAMNQLMDGSGSLSDGLAQLASGATALSEGAESASVGSASLADGAGALDAGMGTLLNGDGTASNTGLRGAAAGARQLADGMSGLPTAMGELSAGLDQISAAAEGSAAKGTQSAQKIQEAATSLGTLLASSSTLSDADKAAISTALGTLQAAADGLASTDPSNYGAIALATGAKQGAQQAKQAIAAQSSQLSSAVAGSAQLASGLEKAVDGTSQLKQGSSKLSGGATELSGGIGQLSEGASQLAAGASSAKAGSRQLADGLAQFNEQAISQVVDLMKDKLGGAIERVKALADAGKSYDNFTGITEGTQGSVKFVIETDAIGE